MGHAAKLAIIAPILSVACSCAAEIHQTKLYSSVLGRKSTSLFDFGILSINHSDLMDFVAAALLDVEDGNALSNTT